MNFFVHNILRVPIQTDLYLWLVSWSWYVYGWWAYLLRLNFIFDQKKKMYLPLINNYYSAWWVCHKYVSSTVRIHVELKEKKKKKVMLLHSQHDFDLRIYHVVPFFLALRISEYVRKFLIYKISQVVSIIIVVMKDGIWIP